MLTKFKYVIDEFSDSQADFNLWLDGLRAGGAKILTNWVIVEDQLKGTKTLHIEADVPESPEGLFLP